MLQSRQDRLLDYDYIEEYVEMQSVFTFSANGYKRGTMRRTVNPVPALITARPLQSLGHPACTTPISDYEYVGVSLSCIYVFGTFHSELVA